MYTSLSSSVNTFLIVYSMRRR